MNVHAHNRDRFLLPATSLLQCKGCAVVVVVGWCMHTHAPLVGPSWLTGWRPSALFVAPLHTGTNHGIHT